eukprot:XP_001696689.1 predicted protein [Chlamydomonas reinhardtii]
MAAPTSWSWLVLRLAPVSKRSAKGASPSSGFWGAAGWRWSITKLRQWLCSRLTCLYPITSSRADCACSASEALPTPRTAKLSDIAKQGRRCRSLAHTLALLGKEAGVNEKSTTRAVVKGMGRNWQDRLTNAEKQARGVDAEAAAMLLRLYFGNPRLAVRINPRPNVVVILHRAHGSNSFGHRAGLQQHTWGLVPSFARLAPGERPDFYRMFNARDDGLVSKPVFSRLLPFRRCVVLLDGFYEWHTEAPGRKQPYHLSAAPPDSPGGAMFLAGLYDVYEDGGGGEPMPTCTIITTDSSKPIGRLPFLPCPVLASMPPVHLPPRASWLHDRMPVILTTQELCRPYGGPLLRWHPVTPEMSKPGYDKPDAAKVGWNEE